MSFEMSNERRGIREQQSLSDDEVARFLIRLSSSLKDKRSGNPALADALLRVASSLSSAELHSKSVLSSRNLKVTNDQSLDLTSLDLAGVTDFLEDKTKTKSELIALASGRFSIPRSKLEKMRSEDVRNAIQSALMHEFSLELIGEEAARSGSRRQT